VSFERKRGKENKKEGERRAGWREEVFGETEKEGEKEEMRKRKK